MPVHLIHHAVFGEATYILLFFRILIPICPADVSFSIIWSTTTNSWLRGAEAVGSGNVAYGTSVSGVPMLPIPCC